MKTLLLSLVAGACIIWFCSTALTSLDNYNTKCVQSLGFRPTINNLH